MRGPPRQYKTVAEHKSLKQLTIEAREQDSRERSAARIAKAMARDAKKRANRERAGMSAQDFNVIDVFHDEL